MGCIAQTAIRDTAKLYKDIDHEVSKLIIQGTYSEDLVGSGPNKLAACKLSEAMDRIVLNRRFQYKQTVMSGDKFKPGEEHYEVLGLGWDT